MRHLTDVFKALGDETRLQMLRLLLRRGELCVCDFVEALGITQSKASRHLRYLAHAGLVLDRRDAVWVFYRVVDSPVPAVEAVLEVLRSLGETPDLAEAEARLKAWLRGKEGGGDCRRTPPRADGSPDRRSP